MFAISLMLIAGLFTNAAIAADGDGTVSVNGRLQHAGFTGLALAASFRYNEALYKYL